MTAQLPYMSQSGIEYNLSRIRSPDSVKMKKKKIRYFSVTHVLSKCQH